MLRETYTKDIIPKLKEKLGTKSTMRIPKLEKIVVNSCLSEAISNSKILETAATEMAQITGQKASIRKAKKSIASFKLREGMPLACMVTLRNKRMYEFFNRLVNIALPRTRDFRGLSRKAFDGQGNYTLGLKEQTIFPEIVTDKINNSWGMNITFVTSSNKDSEALTLLEMMGFPFRKA